MINCVIIDDEPLARECLTTYIEQVDFLQLSGTANNPVAANDLLHEHPVDLLFLDIQMPLMTGIDFLKMKSLRPQVIITTAFPNYALEGYELNVLDYLVKPITFNRFYKAVTKARQQTAIARPISDKDVTLAVEDDSFFIRSNNQYVKLHLSDILFVQAMQNYVTIYTTSGKYITPLYLKTVEEYLNNDEFMRVHKSYLVAIKKVEFIQDNELVIGEHRIPVSRKYKDEVHQNIVEGKLWRK